MENNKHLNELLEALITYAREENEKATINPKCKDYHEGRRDGFAIAAKWLKEAIIEIKFDNIY